MTISSDKIIGISCLHGCAMLFATSLLRNANLIEGDPGAAFLIMLVIAATIVPGAAIGWFCREDLSIGKWLVMAVPYWLVVGTISTLGMFLMNKGVDIRWPAFACAAVAMVVLIFASVDTKRREMVRRKVLKESHNG
jgi:hypothetical protein